MRPERPIRQAIELDRLRPVVERAHETDVLGVRVRPRHPHGRQPEAGAGVLEGLGSFLFDGGGAGGELGGLGLGLRGMRGARTVVVVMMTSDRNV